MHICVLQGTRKMSTSTSMPRFCDLVVDTDIAKAAGGEDARHPVSCACRDFLARMMELNRHNLDGPRLVMSDSLKAEWNSHKSAYTRKWYMQMLGRGYIRDVAIPAELSALLRHMIMNSSLASISQIDAMLNDRHLIEAAIASDLIIISKEAEARREYAFYAHRISNDNLPVEDIAWINPTIPSEDAIAWLDNGAIRENGRMLRNCNT